MLSESYDHLEKTKDELLAERSKLTLENENLGIKNFNLICELSRIKADTIKKMQSEIEARCIKGGIYPAFVKNTIDKAAEEIIKGETEDEENNK